MLTAAGQSAVHEAAVLIYEREKPVTGVIDIDSGKVINGRLAIGYWTRLDIPFMLTRDILFRLMFCGLAQSYMALCAVSLRFNGLPRPAQVALLLFGYYGGVDIIIDDKQFGSVIDVGSMKDIADAMESRYETARIPLHVRSWIRELMSKCEEG